MSDLTQVKVERSRKRVRVYLGGALVADTINSLLVWETPHYPTYYFPMADVRTVHLDQSKHTKQSPIHGEAHCFDVRVGSKIASGAAWHYPHSPVLKLRGHVRFDWEQMDSWFEEDEEVFVHARDPYKRIDILHSSRHVEISAGGV
jgi:uncharacterized protein (DUF427 family)